MGSVFKALKFPRRFLRSCFPGCISRGMSSLLWHSRCKMSLDLNTKRKRLREPKNTQSTLKVGELVMNSVMNLRIDLQLWIGSVASSTAWRPVLPFGPSRQGSCRWWKILWLSVDISVWLRMFFFSYHEIMNKFFQVVHCKCPGQSVAPTAKREALADCWGPCRPLRKLALQRLLEISLETWITVSGNMLGIDEHVNRVCFSDFWVVFVALCFMDGSTCGTAQSWRPHPPCLLST